MTYNDMGGEGRHSESLPYIDYLSKNHKFSKGLPSGEKTPKVQSLKLFLYRIEVLILYILVICNPYFIQRHLSMVITTTYLTPLAVCCTICSGGYNHRVISTG